MNLQDHEATGRAIIQQTTRQLGRRWSKNRDWEDIRAEAHLMAWKAVRRLGESSVCQPEQAAGQGIKYGPAAWFRRDPANSAENFPLSLGDIIETGRTPGGVEPVAIEIVASEKACELLLAPDFAPGLIEQLAAEAAVALCLSTLSPAERTLLALIREKLCDSEIGQRLGMSTSSAKRRRHHVLDHCRSILGLQESILPASCCRNGHQWTEKTSLRDANGKRRCRTCKREAHRRFSDSRRRKKEKQAW